ncbi:hypothetical protein BsWGS_11764 [Bradybaena similaris]
MSCILCLHDLSPPPQPQNCDSPFLPSLSSFTTASMSKVGQSPMVSAMSGHIGSSLQLRHIIKCNQAIVQHSPYRLAGIRPGDVSSMGFRCFTVNGLQPNVLRETTESKSAHLVDQQK